MKKILLILIAFLLIIPINSCNREEEKLNNPSIKSDQVVAWGVAILAFLAGESGASTAVFNGYLPDVPNSNPVIIEPDKLDDANDQLVLHLNRRRTLQNFDERFNSLAFDVISNASSNRDYVISAQVHFSSTHSITRGTRQELSDGAILIRGSVLNIQRDRLDIPLFNNLNQLGRIMRQYSENPVANRYLAITVYMTPVLEAGGLSPAYLVSRVPTNNITDHFVRYQRIFIDLSGEEIINDDSVYNGGDIFSDDLNRRLKDEAHKHNVTVSEIYRSKYTGLLSYRFNRTMLNTKVHSFAKMIYKADADNYLIKRYTRYGNPNVKPVFFTTTKALDPITYKGKKYVFYLYKTGVHEANNAKYDGILNDFSVPPIKYSGY